MSQRHCFIKYNWNSSTLFKRLKLLLSLLLNLDEVSCELVALFRWLQPGTGVVVVVVVVIVSFDRDVDATSGDVFKRSGNSALQWIRLSNAIAMLFCSMALIMLQAAALSSSSLGDSVADRCASTPVVDMELLKSLRFVVPLLVVVSCFVIGKISGGWLLSVMCRCLPSLVPFDIELNAPFLLVSAASIFCRFDIGCSFVTFDDIFFSIVFSTHAFISKYWRFNAQFYRSLYQR